ncbi:MAG: DNA starvation/stationary phase protection protein [Hyphomicrobium sp.]|nr:MAG: DNA starvation/stationary phase protection protein [Hyphomicrobium sp.]
MTDKRKGSNATTAIAGKLGVVLASAYVLQLKTQNFHWNVTGPSFGPLHELFGAQYTEMAAAIDEIAERIRALGETTPGSFAQFGKLSIVADAPAAPPGYEAMIAALAKDHETLSRVCRETGSFADDAADPATGDLMNGRIAAHDKAAWMLRSHLG